MLFKEREIFGIILMYSMALVLQIIFLEKSLRLISEYLIYLSLLSLAMKMMISIFGYLEGNRKLYYFLFLLELIIFGGLYVYVTHYITGQHFTSPDAEFAIQAAEELDIVINQNNISEFINLYDFSDFGHILYVYTINKIGLGYYYLQIVTNSIFIVFSNYLTCKIGKFLKIKVRYINFLYPNIPGLFFFISAGLKEPLFLLIYTYLIYLTILVNIKFQIIKITVMTIAVSMFRPAILLGNLLVMLSRKNIYYILVTLFCFLSINIDSIWALLKYIGDFNFYENWTKGGYFGLILNLLSSLYLPIPKFLYKNSYYQSYFSMHDLYVYWVFSVLFFSSVFKADYIKIIYPYILYSILVFIFSAGFDNRAKFPIISCLIIIISATMDNYLSSKRFYISIIFVAIVAILYTINSQNEY